MTMSTDIYSNREGPAAIIDENVRVPSTWAMHPSQVHGPYQSVMIPAGGDLKLLLGPATDNSVDEAMLLSNAPRPPPGKFPFERLWLSNTSKR
jgi:hypothetical protein